MAYFCEHGIVGKDACLLE
jgi:hypothetical protein